MAISLGDNQFLFCNDVVVPTKLGYVGHNVEEANIPEGILEVRRTSYFDGDRYRDEFPAKVIFKGGKKEFLLWNEEFNGW